MAKEFVIDAEVIDHNATLWDPCGSAGFKHIGWFSSKTFWNPSLDGSTSEPLVFEHREFLQIVKAFDFFERIELQLRFLAKPKRGASRFVKMPLNRLVSMLIESFFGFRDVVGACEPSGGGGGHGGL